MEGDSWARLSSSSSSSSKNHQSRYDLYLGFEEMDGEEESRADYPCPFCPEDFDIIGLCCHIDDEHPFEAKSGVCPVCRVRFGTGMVAHIMEEHEDFFKVQRRRRYRKGSFGSHAAISVLKKELRDGNLQSLLGGSTYTSSTFSALPDPLLSSFMNFSLDDLSKDVQPQSFEEDSVTNEVSNENLVESVEPSLSEKDQEERALRSKFAQGLLLSTIFDETL